MTAVSIDIGLAAELLAARRRSGEQGPRLPEGCRPADLADGLAVQTAVTARLGERIGAWKCGLPAPGKLVVAPIYASTIHTASPCAVWARRGQAFVEPELAFVLACDLPARAAPYSQAEVDAAISRTHLALELIDSRYSEPATASFAEMLADGLVNQGLFIGPEVDQALAAVAADMTIQVRQVNGLVQHHAGCHPSPLPRDPLYWLVEFLRSRGQGLLAGQAVITGSYAGTLGLPLAEQVCVQYGQLGSLSVLFEPR